MNFCISKLIIWFQPEEDPQTLHFLPNKVNVITGNSSTGKSNIIAIINYCLLSEKSNIVEPVINQYSKWYGLELNIEGRTYAIARKRPDMETITSDVYIQEESFSDNFYPSSTNYQIQGARKYLNSLLGYHNDGKEFRFRSNFVFNMLTENIITSPYDYLNINFFDQKYLGKSEFREKLVDEAISPNGLNIDRLKGEYDRLQRRIKKNEKKERKRLQKIEVVNQCIDLLSGNGFDVDSIREKKFEEQVLYLKYLIDNAKTTVKNKEEKSNSEVDSLKKELMMDSINLHNLLSAKSEYQSYLSTLKNKEDALMPIQFLEQMKADGHFTIWTDYIMNSLSKALSKIKKEEIQNVTSALKFDEQITAIEKKIEDKQEKIRQLSALKKTVYFQAQSYRAIGIVEEKLNAIETYSNSNFVLDDVEVNEMEYHNLEELQNLIKEIEQADYKKWQMLEEEFQGIYDKFRYMEFYEGCKTKYNRAFQRLQLRGRDEGYDYDVVGSQSNYMFLHICFFLGFHKYLIDHVTSPIFQFLFIDQPSIPYYVGNEEVNSNDEKKLKDAFRAINDFMDYVVWHKKNQFQIILVEHAPESYWDSESGLQYFHTCEKFLDGEALIPTRIINKDKEND